jgi:hypothetical protein
VAQRRLQLDLLYIEPVVPDGEKMSRNVWVRILTAVLSIFTGLFLLLQVLVAITAPQRGDWFALAIPALMLLGIASMYFVSQKLGEAEEEAVLSYIRDPLEVSTSATWFKMCTAIPT